jgi:uncharacterized protein with HEPN domain
MTRDEAGLLDILNAARAAQRFVAGMTLEQFSGDEKTQSAVLHQLLVLGEAAKRVSAAFRAAHRDIPWRLMTGMRDNLIHEYDEVELSDVWDTIARDLPSLIAAVEPLVPQPGPQQ